MYGMKKIYVIGFVLTVVAVATFFVVQPEAGQNKVSNKNSATTTLKGIRFVQSQSGLLLYTSDHFHYTMLVPESFSQSLAENDERYYPGVLETIEFREINTTTNQDTNRDTPDGFNTSGQNSLTLLTYPNSQGITAQDTDAFQEWYDTSFNAEGIESVDEAFLGGKSVLNVVVGNGIAGAKGRSYFIFSKEYIFVVSSNDVVKSVIEQIVGSFTQLES